MKKHILFLALAIFCFSTQVIPIPKRPHGLVYGNQSSKLQIEAFYDLLCPDTKSSYQQIRQAVSSFPLGTSPIKLSLIFIPLPYHLYSFKVHQGYEFISKTLGSSAADQYIKLILANQDKFEEKKWQSRTVRQFMDSFALFVEKELGRLKVKVAALEFRKALEPGSEADGEARSEWKYSVGSKAVAGTPTYFANGVEVDGAEEWNAKEWKDFFKEF